MPACHDGDGGRTVVVVAHSAVIAALLCHTLGLDRGNLSRFRTDAGGASALCYDGCLVLQLPCGISIGAIVI